MPEYLEKKETPIDQSPAIDGQTANFSNGLQFSKNSKNKIDQRTLLGNAFRLNNTTFESQSLVPCCSRGRAAIVCGP